MSGCNTQYLSDHRQYADLPADQQAEPAPASAQLFRYFANGKTTVDVATQTSDSWLDEDEEPGQEEIEGGPELVVTGTGIDTLQIAQVSTCLERRL